MTVSEIEKKIQKGDRLCTTYANRKHEILMFMTLNLLGDTFTLFAIKDEKIERLGKGDDPLALERKYKVTELIGA